MDADKPDANTSQEIYDDDGNLLEVDDLDFPEDELVGSTGKSNVAGGETLTQTYQCVLLQT